MKRVQDGEEIAYDKKAIFDDGMHRCL
jgi:hypothetical protein